MQTASGTIAANICRVFAVQRWEVSLLAAVSPFFVAVAPATRDFCTHVSVFLFPGSFRFRFFCFLYCSLVQIEFAWLKAKTSCNRQRTRSRCCSRSRSRRRQLSFSACECHWVFPCFSTDNIMKMHCSLEWNGRYWRVVNCPFLAATWLGNYFRILKQLSESDTACHRCGMPPQPNWAWR